MSNHCKAWSIRFTKIKRYIFKELHLYFSEERLLPYGLSEGDRHITSHSLITSERASALITFPDGLSLYNDSVAYSAYVSEEVLLNARA